MKHSFFRSSGLLGCAAFVAFAFCSGAQAAPLTYAQGPIDNPMKGFVAEAWNGNSARPHSLEHLYVAFADVMPSATSFNWSVIDNQIAATNGRGNQLILRVYLDYPGYAASGRKLGIPQWLKDAGLVVRTYDGGASQSPDYENATLRKAMKDFIAAFGARYDGHAGIGAIELGLLGMYGEWHVFVNTSWEPSTTVQDEVFAAYRAAFKKTFLMVSGDAAPRQVGAIGYHHDSYCFYTLPGPSWFFVPEMTSGGNLNNWKTFPIGGEYYPKAMQAVFKNPLQTSIEGEDFPVQNPEDCRQATHISWVRNYQLFENTTNISGGDYDRALAQGRALGYDLHVSDATLSLVSGGNFSTTIALQNKGIAPFYYDWPVQLRLLNSANATVATYNTSWKINGLLPTDSARTLTHTVSGHGLTSGTYKVLMRVVNPLSNGKPLRFANTTQNADQAGWLTLGSVAVTTGGVTTNLSPVGDTFVHDGTPDQTRGNETAMLCKTTSPGGANRWPYLKFDTTGRGTISSAKLRVWGNLTNSLIASMNVSAYGNQFTSSSPEWGESTLTWNNKPLPLSTALASKTITGTGRVMYEFDVTSFVQGEVSAGRRKFGLVLKSTTVNTDPSVTFNSKEASVDKPVLVVVGSS